MLLYRILYYNKEELEKERDSKPLVSVIYKISGDGNQKGKFEIMNYSKRLLAKHFYCEISFNLTV